ncbi:MAG: UDP-N-acetylmuramyl-tripeptide synthetase [Candidatus Doudnabacteria bacterium]|nr:UDP-N-acetylmuramyl-tripeptide synthetase [Candidatus Doudnabacteria bacterium]
MSFLKAIMPQWLVKFVRPYYHGVLALLGGIYFRRPGDNLVVIGITGTAGKSTTAAMINHILNAAGKKCGYITTVDFFDGDRHYLNKHGLSMPGGWLLQKSLRQMADAGCKCAVVECTSEGLAQNRHLGINFDAALFTNLSNAHLEAHGSFGNYRQAKSKLFSALANSSKKSFFPQKIIGANLDDPTSGFFVSFPADKKFGVSFRGLKVSAVDRVFNAELQGSGSPAVFTLDGVSFAVNLLGAFNCQNAALAAACANMLGINLERASSALAGFNGVRGRMEQVSNSLGLNIIVDYGCEPASFKAAVEAAAQLPHNRLIHVFGSTGGHRDKSKRFEFGKTSAQYADYIIITNDDVYDSDPLEIAGNIELGVRNFELRKPKYETVLDRKASIARALSIAQKNDIVLITGKGSEQFLVLPGNKRIQWDEVSVVREELGKLDIN